MALKLTLSLVLPVDQAALLGGFSFKSRPKDQTPASGFIPGTRWLKESACSSLDAYIFDWFQALH